MSKPETVARWIEEAGVPADSVKYDHGNPVVWFACGRCGGAGRIRGFEHVAEGICFACGGSKGRWRGLGGLASGARARAKKAERAASERHEKARRSAREAREFLAAHEGLAVALRHSGTVEIVRSFARQLAWKGRLSDKQVEVAFKVAREEAEKATAPVIHVPEGREAVEGVVKSLKEFAGFAYGTVTWKMLVEDDRGFRVFGSVPAAIDMVKPGDRVRFVAALESKEAGVPGKPGFGYFKRPTKAEYVEKEEEEGS